MTQESNLAGGLVHSKVAPAGLDRVLKKGGGLSLLAAGLSSAFGDCSKEHLREAPTSRFAAILGDSV